MAPRPIKKAALVLAGAVLLWPGVLGCTQTDSGPVESFDSEPDLGESGDFQTPSGKRRDDSESSSPTSSREDIDLNALPDLDRELVMALRDVGVTDAAPGERGFRGSNVVGHDGSQLIQVATTEQDLDYGVDILRTERIRGIDVQVVKFSPSLSALHFWCGPLHYDVRKMSATGGGGVDIDATEEFVDRLVRSLEC